MKAHPAAELFPLIEGAEFDRLVADVEANEQREPITITADGLILDGRNRWRACERLGIAPITRTYHGDDPLSFVILLNLHRRRLNESQRAMVAAKLANMPPHRPADNSANLQTSQANAAGLLNVGVRTVASAARVREDGITELAQAVERGILPVSRAAEIATAAPEFQRSVIARVESGTRATEAIRTERHARISEAPPLPDGKYRVIYADPPWAYNDSRAFDEFEGYSPATEHYPLMKIADIAAMPVKQLAADSAVLLLWCTAPLLPEHLPVIDPWGFTYKQHFIWDKVRPNFGHYHTCQHEILVLATRGSCTPDASKREPSVIRIPRPGPHSAKPPEFREMIDRLYVHGPRIELFARGELPHPWVAWGNQAVAA